MAQSHCLARILELEEPRPDRVRPRRCRTRNPEQRVRPGVVISSQTSQFSLDMRSAALESTRSSPSPCIRATENYAKFFRPTFLGSLESVSRTTTSINVVLSLLELWELYLYLYLISRRLRQIAHLQPHVLKGHHPEQGKYGYQGIERLRVTNSTISV